MFSKIYQNFFLKQKKLLKGNFFYKFSEKKTHGNLKDSDRIFTNIYCDSDPYISGALKRVYNNK